MEQKIVITYNPLTHEIEIVNNDFSTFEAFGILEAAKTMIAKGWMDDNGIERDGE